MKRNICTGLLVLTAMAVHSQDNYYYFHGEKVYLEESTSRRLFVPQKEASVALMQQSYGRWFDSLQPVQGTDAWMGRVRHEAKFVMDQDAPKTYPLYHYQGTPVSVIEKFTVRLKEGVSYQELEALSAGYGTEILGPAPYTENQYYMGVGSSGQTSMNLANRFYETGMFEFAEPHFWLLTANQTRDPYWDRQWGLSNTGQDGGREGVDVNWKGTESIQGMGELIRVAVIDEGVELDHPDLKYTLAKGYSVECGVGGGSLGKNFNHGTLCAGVIVASKDNEIGIAGIASYDSRVVPVCAYACDVYGNILGYTPATLASAIRWAYQVGNVDVISNSWTSNMPIADVEKAINEAIVNGRGGKGCVVVFAAGNEGKSQVSVPIANTENVIVVGGVDRCGIRSGSLSNSSRTCDSWNSGGSNYGSELDVVAPGTSVYTTTTGGGYTWSNGTSLACPHVAGVAALILSVNPYLSQKEVHDIIERTATKLPNYDFSNISGHSNGTWNNEVGYGMVNAIAAMEVACQEINVCDEVFSETTSFIFGCGDISFEDVTIESGRLIIDTPGKVTFGPGFNCDKGAILFMH